MPKAHQQKSRQIIRSFEARVLRKSTPTQKIADHLTGFFGGISFLIINIVIFIFWILVNTGIFPIFPIFDPYPFVLLITLVSLEAIFLTSIVLMSQNREKQINTLRDELQLQVELITEKEISKTLFLLKKILEKSGITYSDKELEEMLKEVDTSYIERRLEQQLQQKSVPEKIGKTLEKKIKNNN